MIITIYYYSVTTLILYVKNWWGGARWRALVPLAPLPVIYTLNSYNIINVPMGNSYPIKLMIVCLWMYRMMSS